MLTQTERPLPQNPANTPKTYFQGLLSDLLLVCFFFHESKKNTKQSMLHFTLKNYISPNIYFSSKTNPKNTLVT